MKRKKHKIFVAFIDMIRIIVKKIQTTFILLEGHPGIVVLTIANKLVTFIYVDSLV